MKKLTMTLAAVTVAAAASIPAFAQDTSVPLNENVSTQAQGLALVTAGGTLTTVGTIAIVAATVGIAAAASNDDDATSTPVTSN